MAKFFIFGLLGLAAVTAWVWLRRQPHDKKVSAPAPPLVVPILTVEGGAGKPRVDADATAAREEVADQPIPNAVLEVTNTPAPPRFFEPEPALANSGDSVSEQATKTSPVTFPADEPQDAESSVGNAEQLNPPEVVVSPEPSTKAEEPTTPALEDVFKNTGSTIAQPNAESISSLSVGKSDAATISSHESAILHTLKKEKTSAEPLQQETPEEAHTEPRPPTYCPTAPAQSTVQPRRPRPTNTRPTQSGNADLRLRVQLVFGRGGVVRTLALAPDRRDGMPSEIEIAGTQGELYLTELRNDCYEPVVLADASTALLQGVEWRGRGDARRWRWVLGGRELYVLAPGDEFGLHGFVSTARLWLNARHVVLATKRLREEVLSALAEAGCATPEIGDDTTPGVPSGWLIFRDVVPTRAVPMRDDRDILNSLCPAHDVEPHFVGGIRLERNIWLAGFPPRIRFTGEFTNGFEVKIDGLPAHPANDGGFEVPGWDSEGEHRLWFGDRAETYSLCTMDEAWEHWHAHDFGTGAAICGASTSQLDGTRRRQVRVPVSNLLLIGARPGEIFHCHSRSDVRCETILAMVSFMPVWALPLDPAHADKEFARILLFQPSEPLADIQMPAGNRAAAHKLRVWISAIREAGCKGLALAAADEQTKALWRRYRVMAKQLRRRMR
jgi:hypothetical protein